MDIGAVVQSPTKDPEWTKKILTMGLFNLIPFAGILNTMGWARTSYQNAKAGDPTLPPAGFSYLSQGVEVFVALLPAIILEIVVSIVLRAPGMVTHSVVLVMLGSLVFGVFALVMGLAVIPTMVYRHFVHNADFSAGMDVGAIMRVITTNVGQFVSFALVWFIGGLIGFIGFPLCCVGALVTMPFGFAVGAAAIKAFEEESGGI